MWQWLRRRFMTGFFVTVPLVVSVVALLWLFRVAYQLTSGLGERLLGQRFPAIQPQALMLIGLVATALLVLGFGVLATNVFGRRLLQQTEALLMRVPLFGTVYAPVKQIIAAFSPDNELGFKRMVMIDDPARGLVLGFLTREFVADRGRGPETLLAVYVPTNHLYLGDVCVFPKDRVSFPDLTIEQGIRIFLTGGMALPGHIALSRTADPGTERVSVGSRSRS